MLPRISAIKPSSLLSSSPPPSIAPSLATAIASARRKTVPMAFVAFGVVMVTVNLIVYYHSTNFQASHPYPSSHQQQPHARIQPDLTGSQSLSSSSSLPPHSQGITAWGCGLDTRPLFFYHVPKTGGGSVRNLLNIGAKASGLAVCWQCAPLPQVPYSCRESTNMDIYDHCHSMFSPEENPLVQGYDVIMGHYNYGCEYLWKNPRSWTTPIMRVTQLRDPIQRLRSHYNFMVSLGDKSAEGKSLVEYIRDYDDMNMRLLQDKFGGPDHRVYAGMTIAVVRLCGQACLGQIQAGKMDAAQATNKAKENLSRDFTVVGITEEMDRFVEMLRRRFSYLRDLPNMGEGKSKVVHVTSHDYKKETQRELQGPDAQHALARSVSLQLEIDLYDHAKAVMEAQWQELQRCPQHPSSSGLRGPSK